ncbi:hypothetical protein ASZ90_001779 [hydrocarbon metagenome]|uniref:Uncharacterized protein n=1 Tax=hydrocarbon metagenome TaxID=938273 RepID=A0A0W8G5N4_9ZZZZ
MVSMEPEVHKKRPGHGNSQDVNIFAYAFSRKMTSAAP